MGEGDVTGELFWKETYDGGSPDAEEKGIQALIVQVQAIQSRHREAMHAPSFARTFHARCVAGSTQAMLVVDKDLPADLQVSHFHPGAVIPASVRLSNACGIPFHDAAPDVRGMAVRLCLACGGVHDLLLANQPASLARDARQYAALLSMLANDAGNLVADMCEAFGHEEARRMVSRLKVDMRLSSSLALECFWSCGAVLWGSQPVRFEFRPVATETVAPAPAGFEPDGLGIEFAARLASGTVCYRLALQRYVGEEQTPIEDCSREWPSTSSPPVEIATLTLPRLAANSPSFAEQIGIVDAISFNPWNAPAEFRPLGNLNRARRLIYSASSQRWLKTSAQPD